MKSHFAFLPVRLWTIENGYRVRAGWAWWRRVYYKLTLWDGYHAYRNDNPVAKATI